jgi:phosphomethylpyrimidine synthase
MHKINLAKLMIISFYGGVARSGVYVTPAEHLRLPTYDDMKEGIIASKIAAHAADIAKKIPNARNRDDDMSKARQRVDWECMFALAIDPEKAKRYRAESMPECEDTCSM